MCNLYSEEGTGRDPRPVPHRHDRTGNLPAFHGIFPDRMAPIARTSADGERELVMACGGMPGPPDLAASRSAERRRWQRFLTEVSRTRSRRPISGPNLAASRANREAPLREQNLQAILTTTKGRRRGARGRPSLCSLPVKPPGAVAKVARAAALQARDEIAERPSMGARDQARRLSHGRPHRGREGEAPD